MGRAQLFLAPSRRNRLDNRCAPAPGRAGPTARGRPRQVRRWHMPQRKNNSLSPAEPTRILLVDDHPLVRQGLAEALTREKDLVICGEAEDRQQALQLAAVEIGAEQFAVASRLSQQGLSCRQLQDQRRVIRNPGNPLLMGIVDTAGASSQLL